MQPIWILIIILIFVLIAVIVIAVVVNLFVRPIGVFIPLQYYECNESYDESYRTKNDKIVLDRFPPSRVG